MNFKLWQIVVTGIALLFLGGIAAEWIATVGSVFKASKAASRGVSTLLEEAAEQMIADPPKQWVVGCLHLLKAVDIRVDDQAYRAALAEIQADIHARLETGGWPEYQAEAEIEQGAKG